MDTRPTATQDKQVTVDVPAERLAEFYAMYARFLSGRRGRRGGRPGGRHHGHGGCGHGRRAPHGQSADVPVAEA